MIKKTAAFLIFVVLILSFCSCGIKNDNKIKSSQSYSFTQRVTVIENYFKERLPEFRFSQEPVERYRDGVSFTLSVTSSQKEFGKYVKKLKDSGFELNKVEADTYYSANTEDGFFAEVTYVGDMLTVFVKKI